MPRILSVAIVLFLTYTARGQQTEVDSLLQVLQQHRQPDTTRIDLLNDIAFAYYSVNPGKGLQFADSAINLARAVRPNRRLASAYSNKGVNYWAMGKDSMAMAMFKQALTIYKAIGKESGMGTIYNNIGLLYFNKSDYYEAINWHRKALEVFSQLKDSSRLASLYNNIGVDYQYISDYPKALEFYFKALTIHEQRGEEHLTANAASQILPNIGIVYKNLGNYDSALVYQNRTLEAFRLAGNKQGMANTFGNIGVIYDLQSKPEDAVSNYLKALELNRELGNQRHLASDYANLGLTYIQLRDYDKSYMYLQKAKTIYEKTEDKHNLTITLLTLGDLYLKAPVTFLKKHQIQPESRYSAATGIVQQALAIARKIEALTLQSQALESLSNIYELAGLPAQALTAFKAHIALRDSVQGEEKRAEIAKKIAAFEFEKKSIILQAEHAKTTALANAEIQRQRIIRNVIAGGGIFLLSATLWGYVSYKRRRDAESRKKDLEFKARVAETEMKALRAQMNPHFIFNSLNSIADFITKNDIPAADDYLSKFAKLMRLILENSEQKEVPLASDLTALELYMQLESRRLNQKFEYKISVADNIDQQNTLVPPLLMQPFVENSIWHGIAPGSNKGLIEIRIGAENNSLTCIVEDNGVGRNNLTAGANRKPESKKSLGMRITKERINILNRNKQMNARIDLFDLNQGLRVELKLPLQTAF